MNNLDLKNIAENLINTFLEAGKVAEEISKKGVKIVYITLHIGLGTFRSILVEDLTRHHMDSEYYDIPLETAEVINAVEDSPEKAFAS